MALICAALVSLTWGCKGRRVADSDPIPEAVQVDLSGKERVVQEQFEAAYAVVAKDERSAAANGGLGMVCEAYDEWPAARVFYQRAVAFEPGKFRWRFYLGRAFKEIGEQGRAIQELERASSIRSDYLALWTHLGELYLAAREQDRAQSAYERALEISDGCAAAHYGLGRIESLRKNHDAAIEHLERSLAIEETQEATYSLAMNYRMLGLLGLAEEYVKRSQQIESELVALPNPLRAEVEQLRRGGSYDLVRGMRLEKAGKDEQAIQCFENVVRDRPELAARAHVRIARIKSRQNDWQAALEHYRRTLELLPDHGATLNDCGVALMRTNRGDEAVRYFLRALEHGSSEPRTRSNLAQAYLELGRIEESLKHYRLALQGAPEFGPARRGLAFTLSLSGEFELSIQAWRTYLDSAPHDSAGLLQYALVLERMGLSEQANEARRRAAKSAQRQGSGETSG